MSIRIDPSRQTKNIELESLTSATRSEADFGKVLKHTQELQRAELENFLQKLQEQGENLVRNRTLRNVKEFQEMVRAFLRSTLGQSRTVSEEQTWDFRGRPKIMARVTKIDHALEELGRRVLDEQSTSLDILAKIDEIRGLIIDLFA